MTIPLRRAAFLDRDGVLNRAIVEEGHPRPPSCLSELEVLPDAPAALLALKAAGFLSLVVTNQPDVARGTQRRETVEEINSCLSRQLPIDEFLVCYHDDVDHCDCRKPRPGLLLEAARRHEIELARSYMVGDRWRDIEAGQNAGCWTVFIDRAYRERQPVRAPTATVASLAEAAAWILSHSRLNEVK